MLQVLTRDITYLHHAHIRGGYFYLYLFVDIWSRRIVGAEVHDMQSADHGRRQRTCHLALDVTSGLLNRRVKWGAVRSGAEPFFRLAHGDSVAAVLACGFSNVVEHHDGAIAERRVHAGSPLDHANFDEVRIVWGYRNDAHRFRSPGHNGMRWRSRCFE